jgi:hypothetical protein
MSTEKLDPTPDTEYDPEQAIDMESVESEIAAGAKAYGKLLRHAADDWNSWSIVIVGMRGLRNLAFAKSQTSDIASWHYRKALGDMLKLKKYSIYDQIGKQTRSVCYKLMDSVDEINVWYAGLSGEDKLKWKHPESIAKNCPKHLVDRGRGGNLPPKQTVKKLPKPLISAETERLKALLIQVIKRLAKHEPDALELLDQIMPKEPELDDSVEDI